MKIAFISSEVFPFSKTGGLADVSGSLPIALKQLGVEIIIITPFYNTIHRKKFGLGNSPDEEFTVNIKDRNFKAGIFSTSLPGTNIKVFLIENNYYFGRNKIYTQDEDEGERFVFFNLAALELLKRSFKPDIIHLNDWQTSLISYYLKHNYFADFKETGSLLTIHNIGYQGNFPPEIIQAAGIDGSMFYPTGPAEFFGNFNFLKMGIVFADKLNTVSPTYAREILTSEFGAGLEGVLKTRKKDLTGILNGVDYVEWNPISDLFIVQNYDIHSIEKKINNKEYLCDLFEIKFDPNTPLIGMVSRLVYQKGIDLVIKAIPELMKFNLLLIILGNGEPEKEKALLSLADKYPDKLKVISRYNNVLAHQIEAAADAFLMPSRYEPCGLNQIYSLKYGTVPIARKTGGLADTIIDAGKFEGDQKPNGFLFVKYSANALIGAVRRALTAFQNKKLWHKLIINGMQMDFSWKNSAKSYIELYYNIIKQKKRL